jgi:tetratricopeptide (TPR) repeat protein
MSGPSSGDYYKAADFYLSQKMELPTALDYINKALDMREDKPFWYLRRKALIQAELGDYKNAIETAKLSLAAAEKANYDGYIKSNKKSIEEWSKKLK